MRKISTLLLLCFTVTFTLHAQDKPNIKFGKISVSDFTINSPVVDSNADAVVLADIGNCKLVGNNKGWFTVVFTEHKRIKIINKKGFSAADINILLYKYEDAGEKIKDLKAATYNVENGSVVSTKLNDKDVFDETENKNYHSKKFSFPAVTEGSIIEYSYTIESDFLVHLYSWKFQGKYPCLWSAYQVNIPEIFNYMILKQGALNYAVNTTGGKSQVFNIKEPLSVEKLAGSPETFVVNTNVIIKDWAMKDVPAMRPQDYTSSIENYIAKLEFQLSEYRFPEQPVENKMKDWDMTSKDLLKYDDFGKPINDDNPWVADELKNINTTGLADEQKARNVFAYVRDNYTWTGWNGIFLSEGTGLKDIIKKKNGSVSDLNLLLIRMLRQAGLNADPVILSTRKNGTIHPKYPMLKRFNYLICQVKINDKPYYLDASNHYLGFGKLQSKCYNGMARVISDPSTVVYFNADDLTENKTIYVQLSNSASGITGKYNAVLGYQESLALREKVEQGKQSDYLNEEQKKYPESIVIKNISIDSFKNYENPVALKLDIDVTTGTDNLFYFSPILPELMKENPFKSQDRLYPVEMGNKSSVTYNLDMEIPAGYKVEELPKSQSIVMTDNAAKFEYEILQAAGHIKLRCRLQFNKTFFDAGDYENIRSFFAQIINKEDEQIVFKKTN